MAHTERVQTACSSNLLPPPPFAPRLQRYLSPVLAGELGTAADPARLHDAFFHLAYVRAAKTWAAAAGRTYVLPDDIKDLAPYVLGHRVLLEPEAEFAGRTASWLIDRVLSDVPPPATTSV